MIVNFSDIKDIESSNRCALVFLVRAVELALSIPDTGERVQATGRALRAYSAARRELDTGDVGLSPMIVWCDNLAEFYADAAGADALFTWTDLIVRGLISEAPRL